MALAGGEVNLELSDFLVQLPSSSMEPASLYNAKTLLAFLIARISKPVNNSVPSILFQTFL